MTRITVMAEISTEARIADAAWPANGRLPDGTGQVGDRWRADTARALCDRNTDSGSVTWRDVLAEEVSEAFAESDTARLRAELVQVAAVALRWIEALDRRSV